MSAHVTEEGARLYIISSVGWPVRLILAGMAGLPLIAPIELMLRIRWHGYAQPLFILAAAISAVALALSLLLILSSLSTLDRRTMIDATADTFVCSESSPVTRLKNRTFPLSELEEVCVLSERWTDGPTYSLALKLEGGCLLPLASSFSRPQLETFKSTIDAFLTRCSEETYGHRTVD